MLYVVKYSGGFGVIKFKIAYSYGTDRRKEFLSADLHVPETGLANCRVRNWNPPVDQRTLQPMPQFNGIEGGDEEGGGGESVISNFQIW